MDFSVGTTVTVQADMLPNLQLEGLHFACDPSAATADCETQTDPSTFRIS